MVNKNKKTGNKNPQKLASQERQIAALTRTVAQLAASSRNRKSSSFAPSDIGKALLHGGNAVAGIFGNNKFFGSGAYRLGGGNTSWNTTNQVPVMHNDTDKVTFSHREYIGEISSSAAFAIQTRQEINPTNQELFPYLAGIAACFQQFRFKGLVFEFKSTSADALNSTNTALGAILMAAQYRTGSPAFTSKVEMMNEMWSVDTKPSLNAFLPIECAPKETPMSLLYTDNSDGDPKFSTLATITVASNGSQAAAIVGELWVTYEIELYKPKLADTAGPTAFNFYHYQGFNLDPSIAPIGIRSQVDTSGNFDVLVARESAGYIRVEVKDLIDGGLYYIRVVAVECTAASNPTFTLTATSNMNYEQVLSPAFTTVTYVQGDYGEISLFFKATTPNIDDKSVFIFGTTAVGATAYLNVIVHPVGDMTKLPSLA
jgi:hypothetical protein